jgi:hypothetical protein
MLMHLDRLQIILFDLFSGSGWAILLAVWWLLLVYIAAYRLKFRAGAMLGLLVAITVQACIAATAAVLTSEDILNDFSCLAGALGILIVPLATVVEAGLLFYASKQWPRNTAGKRDCLVGWVLIWFAFKWVIWFVLMRSGLMCTV